MADLNESLDEEDIAQLVKYFEVLIEIDQSLKE